LMNESDVKVVVDALTAHHQKFENGAFICRYCRCRFDTHEPDCPKEIAEKLKRLLVEND